MSEHSSKKAEDDYQKALLEYRSILLEAEQEAQSDFDKNVLALSGGGLGLSFAFIKDIVNPANMIDTGFLLAAWIGWGASSAAVLLSYFSSRHAMAMAIKQLDENKLPKEEAGGWINRTTKLLNWAGLLLFLFGLGMMITFLCLNLKDHMPENDDNKKQLLTEGRLVPAPPADKTQQAFGGRLVPTPPANTPQPTPAEAPATTTPLQPRGQPTTPPPTSESGSETGK